MNVTAFLAFFSTALRRPVLVMYFFGREAVQQESHLVGLSFSVFDIFVTERAAEEGDEM